MYKVSYKIHRNVQNVYFSITIPFLFYNYVIKFNESWMLKVWFAE